MAAIFQTVSFLAAVVATFTGVLVWRRRRTSPLARPLVLMLLAASAWAVARALLGVLVAPLAQWVLLSLVFPLAAVVVAATFAYCLVLSGNGRLLTRWTVAALAVHPLLLVLAAATAGVSEVFLRWTTTAEGEVQVDAGPLYGLHVGYSYTLVALGLVLLVRAMLRAVRGHRGVYVMALVAALVPFVGNVLGQVLGTSDRGIHLTPILFLVSAGLWLRIERSGHRGSNVPISAQQVLAALPDAVVVVDPDGVLLDLNPSAGELLAGSAEAGREAVGAHWRAVVAPELVPVLDVGPGVTTTVAGRVLDVRVTPMRTGRGQALGAVVVIRDVTEIERLRAELAELAARDGLTGLHNRRHLETALRAAIERTAATGEPLSAVMVDIDHFKEVNDRYGHAVGDQLLVQVAQTLAAGVRGDDTVARFGGEEFVLLLPGVPAPDAAARADGWRRRCAATEVGTVDGPVRVTISLGVVAAHPGETSDDLLRRADAALYEAKAAGRDVVVVGDGA